MSSDFTLTVEPVNDAPIAISAVGGPVAENSSTGTVVATLSTVDPDAGDLATYTLVSGAGSTDNGLVSVFGDQIIASGAIDFETNPTLDIRVKSTDAAGLSVESALMITVADVAEMISGTGRNDTLTGGVGADIIVGGLGRDTMTGLQGADVFDFNSLNDSTNNARTADVITDFRAGGLADRIDLSTIDANGTSAGDPSFGFVGASTFTALAQVRAFVSGSDTIIEVNGTGNTNADMVIKLAGFTGSLAAADFIL